MGLMAALTLSFALALDFFFLPALLLKADGQGDGVGGDSEQTDVPVSSHVLIKAEQEMLAEVENLLDLDPTGSD